MDVIDIWRSATGTVLKRGSYCTATTCSYQGDTLLAGCSLWYTCIAPGQPRSGVHCSQLPHVWRVHAAGAPGTCCIGHYWQGHFPQASTQLTYTQTSIGFKQWHALGCASSATRSLLCAAAHQTCGSSLLLLPYSWQRALVAGLLLPVLTRETCMKACAHLCCWPATATRCSTGSRVVSRPLCSTLSAT